MSWVILQELTGKRMFVQLNKKCKIGKQFIRLTSDIEMNRYYQVSQGNLSLYNHIVESVKDVVGDNSSYFDDSSAQGLTQEDVLKLREEAGGSKVIEELVNNSTTFTSKTQFSQEKYLKKKKQKHLSVFQIIHPTAAGIADTLYEQKPGTGLRSDTLFNLIMLGNVHCHSRAIVIDETNGILLGTVIERCLNTVMNAKTELSNEKALKYFPRHISSSERYSQMSINEITGEFDSALIACREDLKEKIGKILTCLGPSGSLAAFSWDICEAAQVYEDLLGNDKIVNICLEEVWSREYQVLSERTHPVMSNVRGSSSGGYIISGTRIN